MRLRNVAVDFDGTLVYGDKLISGAKEAMQSLRDAGYVIYIFSCNGHDWIQKVLNKHEVPYDYIYDSERNVGKPICDWYIDDRAIGFRGNWKAVLEELYGADARTKAWEK